MSSILHIVLHILIFYITYYLKIDYIHLINLYYQSIPKKIFMLSIIKYFTYLYIMKINK